MFTMITFEKLDVGRGISLKPGPTMGRLRHILGLVQRH
jgi:hypothetical protein